MSWMVRTTYKHVDLKGSLPPPLLDEIDQWYENGDIRTRSIRVFEAISKWIHVNTNWDIQFDEGRVSAWAPRFKMFQRKEET